MTLITVLCGFTQSYATCRRYSNLVLLQIQVRHSQGTDTSKVGDVPDILEHIVLKVLNLAQVSTIPCMSSVSIKRTLVRARRLITSVF